MTDTPTTSPPANRRAGSRVDSNLRNAVVALVVAIGIQVGLVASIFYFDASLQHHAPGYSTCPPTSYVVTSTTVRGATTTSGPTANTVPGVPGLAPAAPSKNTGTVIHVDC